MSNGEIGKISQTEFRQKLESAFSKDQLQTLCFDIGIDYENLPETKEGMARELIQYCIRQNRAGELIEICRQQRPTTSWPDLTDFNLTSPVSEQKGCTAYWGNRTISIMVFMSLTICTASYLGSLSLFTTITNGLSDGGGCSPWIICILPPEVQKILFYLFLIMGFVGLLLIGLIAFNITIHVARRLRKRLQGR